MLATFAVTGIKPNAQMSINENRDLVELASYDLIPGAVDIQVYDNYSIVANTANKVEILELKSSETAQGLMINYEEVLEFSNFGHDGDVVMDIDLYANNTRMFIYTLQGNLYTINLDDITSPYQLSGSSWLSGVDYNNIMKMRDIENNDSIFAIEDGTFYMYQVNTDGQFTIYGRQFGNIQQFLDVTGMYVVNNYAYITNSTGMKVFDLGVNYDQFVMIGEINGFQILKDNYSHGSLYLHNNIAYIFNSYNSINTIRILNVTDPSNIMEISSFEYYSNVNHLQVEGDLLYFCSNTVLSIFNMSSIKTPELILEKPFNTILTSIYVDTNFIYTTQGEQGVTVYSDSQNLVRIPYTITSTISDTQTTTLSQTITKTITEGVGGSTNTDSPQLNVPFQPFMIPLSLAAVIILQQRKRDYEKDQS